MMECLGGKLRWFFLCGMMGLCLAVLPCTADMMDEYRVFTSTSGQVIEARALAFDAEQGTVTLQRRNGKSGTVPADTLSAEDQAYLAKWLTAQEFLNQDQLEIHVNFVQGNWTDAGDERGNRKKREDQFEISLTNHGYTTLTNINLEYCQYRDRGDYISSHNMSVKIEDLTPGKRFETTSRTTGWRRGGSFLNATVGGRFRFMMTMSDGTQLMREICTPKPLPPEKFPWVESEKAREERKASMPDPASYPDRVMTEKDVQALAEQYIAIWEKEDFDTWTGLLSPMHPGDAKLTKSRFMGHISNIKFMKIEEIAGRNVKVKVYYKSGHDPEYWLQITSSGYIKYTPLAFRHPMLSIQRLHLLLHEESSMRNTGYTVLTTAAIPSFGYNRNDSSSDNRKEITSKIMAWIREHGATHDAGEPKVFLPQEAFTECLYDAERNIEYTSRRFL